VHVLLYAAMAFVPLQAEQPEYCIAGTVLNASTDEPLRRAAVTIPQSASLTDASGAFRFCGLPAGDYYANAEKPGFVESGAHVAAGPSREDIVLRLQPLSAIAGKVSDAAGEPLDHVLIQLLSIRVLDGRRKAQVEYTTSTDDRGQYRLADLTPGRYFLRAAGWDGAADSDANEAFAPAYYGGAASLASASPATIEAGRDLQADFSLTLRPAYRIRGAITGFSPPAPLNVALLGPDGDPNAAPVNVDSATGKFRIDGVPPGDYRIRASQGEGRRGEVPLPVDADVPAVLIPLSSGVLLRGIVRMPQDAGQSPRSPNCAITLSPAEAWVSAQAPLEASTEPNGEFEIQAVPPGRYRLRLACGSGYISALRMANADLMDGGELIVPAGTAPPIEALLEANGGKLDVTASTEGERTSGWLLLLPASGNQIHARFVRLNGKAAIPAIAPDDYQVYAWTGSPELFEYANPDARQAWAGRAISVHIGENDRQSITIKIAPGETP
jgi:hypothetical protein